MYITSSTTPAQRQTSDTSVTCQSLHVVWLTASATMSIKCLRGHAKRAAKAAVLYIRPTSRKSFSRHVEGQSWESWQSSPVWRKASSHGTVRCTVVMQSLFPLTSFHLIGLRNCSVVAVFSSTNSSEVTWIVLLLQYFHPLVLLK